MSEPESQVPESPLDSAAGAAEPHVTEAFKLLSDEIRLAILLALWEVYAPRAENNAISFSQLLGRVGVRDSGNFSYHLDKLVGHYVEETDDAIGVAVSEAGKRLNETDKQYVEVEPGVTGCPACGEPFDAAFLAANTALVGLLLEIDIFNADSEEHAERIAKSEVGGALRDVPLEVIEIVETEGDEDETDGDA